ncbi:citF 1 [Limosilactobacillus fermentum]|nr:citF 1 [Limosilactobacillus fermentum]
MLTMNTKKTIISAPLTQGRIATVVPSVNSVSTPGASVDVLVTEVGIAINPARQDLVDAFSKVPSLPIVSIEELQKRAEATVGKPAPVEYTDRVVGLVEYRDGSLIDAIKQVKD